MSEDILFIEYHLWAAGCNEAAIEKAAIAIYRSFLKKGGK